MGRRALRSCAEPGCPVLSDSARCPDHQRERHKDPEQARFYGSTRWKKLRAQVRREDPLCRLCSERPTESVDHIDGDWRNNARSNLRGLCGPCEKVRTGQQHAAKARDGEREQSQAAPEREWWFV